MGFAVILLLEFLIGESLLNFVCSSKPVGGGEIKALLLEINISRFVSSVLPPTRTALCSRRPRSSWHGSWRRWVRSGPKWSRTCHNQSTPQYHEQQGDQRLHNEALPSGACWHGREYPSHHSIRPQQHLRIAARGEVLQQEFSPVVQIEWAKLSSRPTGDVDLLIGSESIGLHPVALKIRGDMVVKRSRFGGGFVLNGTSPQLKTLNHLQFTEATETIRVRGFDIGHTTLGVD